MTQTQVPEPQLMRSGAGFRMQELGLIIVVVLVGMFLWWQSENIARTLPAKQITNSTGEVVKTLPMRTVQENKFLRTSNLVPIVFTVMSWMAIMAIGQTIVIIGGGIDISVGSVSGLAAVACALVLQSMPDAPAWQVLSAGIGVPLAVGLVCGLINGSLVVGLRIHPFIVTLVTLSIFRWACVKLTPLGSLPSGDNTLPAAFTDGFIAWTLKYPRYDGQYIESVQPVPMLLMIAAVILGWLYLSRMVAGRETYAIGGNEEAARFSGIRVSWAKIRLYMLSGLAAGAAGMISCGYYKAATSNSGAGDELIVVAAAVVGGASLTGGRGTALGAALGALVLQLINNGVSILSEVHIWLIRIPVQQEDYKLIDGISILLAVLVDRASVAFQDSRLMRAKSR